MKCTACCAIDKFIYCCVRWTHLPVWFFLTVQLAVVWISLLTTVVVMHTLAYCCYNRCIACCGMDKFMYYCGIWTPLSIEFILTVQLTMARTSLPTAVAVMHSYIYLLLLK